MSNKEWIPIEPVMVKTKSNNKNQSESEVKTKTASVSATDVIYRTDAINALKRLQKDITGDYMELDQLVMAGCGYIGDCICELEELPSAQQWIPVEERLPEDGVYVLICDGEHFKDYDCKNGAYSQIAVGWTEQGEFRCWDDRTHMSKVIAWMPLPEPYKGD